MSKLDPAAEQQDTEKSRRKNKLVLISSLILAIAVLICLIVTVQTLTTGYTTFFGYSMFRVVTGSMEPTIPENAVIICKHTDIDQIEEEDIICFISREASHYGAIVTHRVKEVRRETNGEIRLVSRGDANTSADPYLVSKDNLVGKVTWYTGKEGFLTKLLAFMSGKVGFMAIIIMPIILIVGLVLYSAGKNIRGELNSVLDQLSKKNTSPKDELLPGYKTLTKRDYEEIYQSIKRELWKELYGRVETSEGKTEYPDGKKD